MRAQRLPVKRIQPKRRTSIIHSMLFQTLLFTSGISFQLQPPKCHQTSGSLGQITPDLQVKGRAPAQGPGHARPWKVFSRNFTLLSRMGPEITPTAELGDVGSENDQRYRRKPRRAGLRRNEAGLPTEKVYAPRISAYGKHKVSGGSGGMKRIRPQGQEREVSLNNAAKLRVAGGVAKGRRLESPDVFLRPMMGKVKEALFNTLTGFGVFETNSARFLDLFSGSGAVGVEALSRGAGHATFVDFAKDCCEVSLRNSITCGFADQAKAVRGDVFDVLYNPRKFGLDTPYDVVVVTPPYEEVVYADLIKALAASDLVTRDTIVVLEYPVELGCLPHAIGDGSMVGLRNRRYGRTVIGVWVNLPSGQNDDLLDSRPEEFISINKK